MRKYLILLLIAVSLSIIISGCNSTCNKPYFEYKKGDCCLDKNQNSICDKYEGSNTEEAQNKEIIVKTPEKESCSYECCIGIDFKKKICKEGYECENYKCKIIDSDKDGLGDVEERSLGTNPNIFDTDGDGLSDFQEVKTYKTNPLTQNTDNDRYNDKEDKEPLITNSARLKLDSKEVLGDLEDIAELIDNFRNFEWWIDQLANPTKEMIITIKNEGNDHTEGFSFNIATHIVFTKAELDGILCSNERFLSKEKAKTQKFTFADKIKPEQTIQKTIIVDFITSIPQNLKLAECQGFNLCPCNTKISHSFEHIEYERYP